MPDSLDVRIDDSAVRRLLRDEFPKFTNQAMNRAYRTVASKFTRDFARKRLGAAGPFNVRRKVQLKKLPRGQPKIAPKARRAGFVASLTGQNSINKKSLSIRTGNPLLLQREFGGKVPDPTAKGARKVRRGTYTRGKKRRLKDYIAVKLRRRGRGAKSRGPDIRLVREVRFEPTLGFRRAWTNFRGETRRIIDKALSDLIVRINKRSERRRAA